MSLRDNACAAVAAAHAASAAKREQEREQEKRELVTMAFALVNDRLKQPLDINTKFDFVSLSHGITAGGPGVEFDFDGLTFRVSRVALWYSGRGGMTGSSSRYDERLWVLGKRHKAIGGHKTLWHPVSSLVYLGTLLRKWDGCP